MSESSNNTATNNKLTVETIKELLTNINNDNNKLLTIFTPNPTIKLSTNNTLLTGYDENTKAIHRRINIIDQAMLINNEND